MIKEMYRKGISISEIARRTGRDRKTIRQMVTAPLIAAPKSRKQQPRKIDPYVPYLESRITDGVLNAHVKRDFAKSLLTAKLYREIRDQGYTGSRPLVGLLIADLRRLLPPPEGSPRAWLRKGTPTAYPRLRTPKPPVRTPPKRRPTTRRSPDGTCSHRSN